ncbi:MAG: hypothetical protein Q4B72_06240, partial [Lachnospiraceae bacterium]|nr:hypothetical protein [Lachnospiraceae bacterium]
RKFLIDTHYVTAVFYYRKERMPAHPLQSVDKVQPFLIWNNPEEYFAHSSKKKQFDWFLELAEHFLSS